MDNLQLPHAKLLYFIAELWKGGNVTDSEKTLLKEMVISDEAKIFEFLEEYENSSDENALKRNVIGLVKPQERSDALIVIGSHNHDPPMQDEISSPLGASLLDRKKQHHGMSELQGLAQALKPTA